MPKTEPRRRRRGESLSRACPACYAFGPTPRQLAPAEAVTATPDERIASVWAYVVGRVLSFQRTLRPRERANFDVEDTLLDVWVALRERDAKWRPERGRYITFANRVVKNCLFSVRERSRTIESPRNCTCRIKEYQQAERAGTLSPAQRRTLEAMIRSLAGPATLDAAGDRVEPDRGGGDADAAERLRWAVVESLVDLDPYEAVLVGASLRLWGQPAEPLARVGQRLGLSPRAARRLRDAAVAKLRRRLENPALGSI